MQLIEINKQRYRKHLAIVIVTCIGALIIGSLAISQTLIALFPNPSGSHFTFNLLGVLTSTVLIGLVLHKCRHHPFMTEVVYVWDLKQILNKINRKMNKLKQASEQGNRQAMLAIQYSYSGSRLLWHLDDNNIVLDELVVQQAELDSLIAKHKVKIELSEFTTDILNQF